MNYKYYIVTTIIGIVIGIIGFFLKRTMNRIDKMEQDMKKYEPSEAHDKDMIEVKNKLQTIEDDLKEFPDKFLKQEEFVRSMAEINHKFDRIEDKIDRNGKATESKLDKLLMNINKG